MRAFHTRRRTAGVLLLIGFALLLAGCGSNDNRQNVLHPHGSAADKIASLFSPVFWVAVIIGVAVLIGTFYVALRFRARPGNENPKQIHGSTPLEVGWTIVPALILIVVAVPTVSTIFDLAKTPKGDVLEVTVIGKQWWWEYQYPKEKIVTATELHMPTGRPVRLSLKACEGTGPASCNVIHSFWVPELAGKTDVVPGRTNHMNLQTDEPGTYLGQCAEFCGLSHANMHLRVIVESPDRYAAWVAGQQKKRENDNGAPVGAVAKLLTDSKNFGCTGCHQFTDPTKVGYGPNLAHLASRTVFAGGAYELNRKNLTDWVLDAPGMVPMESEDCRLPPPATCVGMPSFTKHTPAGGYRNMTKEEADEIVDYLLAAK